MAFNFEKFTKVGSSFAPTVSLRKQGAIGISQGALNRFGLVEGDWFVILYFDRSANVLGIQPTQNAEDEGAIKLIKRRAAGKNGKISISSSISAKSFFEYYSISALETRSFLATLDEQTKMIVIDLNKPIEKIDEDDDEN